MRYTTCDSFGVVGDHVQKESNCLNQSGHSEGSRWGEIVALKDEHDEYEVGSKSRSNSGGDDAHRSSESDAKILFRLFVSQIAHLEQQLDLSKRVNDSSYPYVAHIDMYSSSSQ